MLHLSPWPWYVVGPLIVITMASLLLVGKRFGHSSNLQTVCAAAGADRLTEYFRIDWLSRSWNLVFVAGTIAGGAVARYLLLGDHAVALNPGTCPGPLFITVGAGYWPILVAILGALLGTLMYGVLKSKLPH